jgi:hypothetical protein
VSSGDRADRPLLLDASVWLAALDRDDPHHGSARRLLEATASGKVELAALELTLSPSPALRPCSVPTTRSCGQLRRLPHSTI